MTVTLQPRQQAAILTLTNSSQSNNSVQIRAFNWSQTAEGVDKLETANAIAVSPPLVTIPPGGKQIVRLVLRQSPQDTEATYRVLIDQIPSVAQANEVRVALRLSLPIFAEPQVRVLPQLRYAAEAVGSELHLVVTNAGKRHETLRDIKLHTPQGAVIAPLNGTSPYLLPGATRRWLIGSSLTGERVTAGSALRLTASTEQSGAIERTMTVSQPR